MRSWRRLLLVAALVAGPSSGSLSGSVTVTATPSPASPGDLTGGTGWPAGGRLVATQFVDTRSVLPSRIYAQSIPPELAPQTFSFQKVAAGGYQAELDFPSAVVQLHSYLALDGGDEGGPSIPGSVPVRHTIELVLRPPSGDQVTATLQADGTTTVTRGGAGIGSGRTIFAGNRVLIGVPASAGVGPDWTVQAVIRLTGDQPLKPGVGANGLPEALAVETMPAVVGVLDGDDHTGPEPIAGLALAVPEPLAGEPSTGGQALPDGARPVAVHLEQRSSGLVAVVTMDSPPRPPSTVGGKPSSGETVSLSLAPAVQDGLTTAALRVDWSDPACSSTTCPGPAKVGAVVATGGTFLGTVPVTVAGSDVRFDLGGFQPTRSVSARPPTFPPEATSAGGMTGSDTLSSSDIDLIPLGDAPAEPPNETVTIKVDHTDISITRSPDGSTATGILDPFSGYFFASDAHEMWSGWLGKQGWYAHTELGKPAAARLAGPRSDVNDPSVVYRAATYAWRVKAARLGITPDELRLDETDFGADLLALMLAGASGAQAPTPAPPPDFSGLPPSWFVDRVAHYLHENPDKLRDLYPVAIDPVVVAPPAAVPFPLAKQLPVLAPPGGQWEIAVDAKVLDTTSAGLHMLGPYVPASSLVTGGTSSQGSGEAGAVPGGAGVNGVSTDRSSGFPIVPVIVVAIVAAALAAVTLRVRRRRNI